MIDLNIYRARIGLFNPRGKCRGKAHNVKQFCSVPLLDTGNEVSNLIFVFYLYFIEMIAAMILLMVAGLKLDSGSVWPHSSLGHPDKTNTHMMID